MAAEIVAEWKDRSLALPALNRMAGIGLTSAGRGGVYRRPVAEWEGGVSTPGEIRRRGVLCRGREGRARQARRHQDVDAEDADTRWKARAVATWVSVAVGWGPERADEVLAGVGEAPAGRAT
jgi:hypothetical protein